MLLLLRHVIFWLSKRDILLVRVAWLITVLNVVILVMVLVMVGRTLRDVTIVSLGLFQQIIGQLLLLKLEFAKCILIEIAGVNWGSATTIATIIIYIIPLQMLHLLITIQNQFLLQVLKSLEPHLFIITGLLLPQSIVVGRKGRLHDFIRLLLLGHFINVLLHLSAWLLL